MRKISLLSLLLFLAILTGLTSCSEEEGNDNIITEGQIEFSAKVLDSAEKSYSLESNDISSVSSAIITIVDELGETIYESEKVDFYKFNDVYITEPLSLLTGSYVLTNFYLVDEADSVLYASPMESSAMEYLVEEPLPISFSITADEVTTVYPEVLNTNGYQPEDFGYSSFGLNQVEIFDFLLTVFKYNPSIEEFELTDAELLVTGDEDTLYNNSLGSITNKITLPDGYNDYSLTIIKPGFNRYNYTFTSDSLKNHYSNPLTVILEIINPAEGLIAYYPFDGNAYDCSGYENHATNYGATLTTNRFGNESSAYAFNGNGDYMNCGNKIVFGDEISISLWFRSLSQEEDIYFIEKYNWLEPYENGVALGVINNTEVQFCGRNQNNIFVRAESSGMNLIDDAWHNVIGVIRNNVWELWIDGNLIESKDHLPGNLNNNDDLIIGNLIWGEDNQNRFFCGSIDDIKIYNRPLTEDEILTLYHEGGWDQ